MKVLWLSHHREHSGWADASINSILALDSVGVDVVPVNISLTGAMAEVPARIEELEKKSTDDCTVCVQNILPHHMIASDRFDKNIAYIVTETSTIRHTPWVENLRHMSAVWTPNVMNTERMMADIGDEVDCFTVPYAFNIEEYDTVYDKWNLPPGKFRFYYIGDMNDRKNLEVLLRCYHATFAFHEDVELVLKVSKFGLDKEQLNKYVSELTGKVKTELRIFPNLTDYQREVVITDRLDRVQLLNLHNTCDCFVTASHGEGWCIPAFDAMALGSAPICVKEGGPADFINNEGCGTLVPATYGPCLHKDAAFPFLSTGLDQWANVDEMELMSAMSYNYRRWKRGDWDRSQNRKHGLMSAENYDYETIGNTMKELINEN